MKIELLTLEETDSTNNWLKEHRGMFADRNVAVRAIHQTAGRGQGSNTWESETGKNMLLSVLTHPTMIAPNRQFVLSMCGALAVRDVALNYIGSGVTLKWPNDVYWNDSKLSGMLIECSIKDGQIYDCIFGVGLNVNQTEFRSDAPNPVSIARITGKATCLEEITKLFIETFAQRCDLLYAGREDDISSEYHQALYRREGLFAYKDAHGQFNATMLGVDTYGHLLLRDDAGRMRQYGFKEVVFV